MSTSETLLESILSKIEPAYHSLYKPIISIFATAIEREEHLLLSFPPAIKEIDIESIIEFIFCSFFPLTITIFRRDGSFEATRVMGEPSKHKNIISPFRSNGCIVEKFDKREDTSQIIRTMREQAFMLGEDSDFVPVPFLVIALVDENSFVPRNTLQYFSFHIHIPAIPSKMPTPETPVYRNYEAFTNDGKGFLSEKSVFSHQDITSYISQLVLNLDCKPLITSFIEVKTKLLLIKTIKEYANFQGRDYVLPDDVQIIFPFLVTHKFLLPGKTTFRNCVNFVQEIISAVASPI